MSFLNDAADISGTGSMLKYYEREGDVGYVEKNIVGDCACGCE